MNKYRNKKTVHRGIKFDSKAEAEYYDLALWQAQANGWKVNIELPDGTELVIRQSYLKDMAAPVLIDRFNVTDSVVENHLKKFRSSIDDTFRLGS